jgi:streptogrisin C
MLRTVQVLLVAASVALPIAGPPPTSGATGPAASNSEGPGFKILAIGTGASPDDASNPDAEAIRDAQGWTRAQMAAYERSEVALDVVTERLSTDYPEAFVGSALADDPAGASTVYIKGPAPSDIRALADELGVTVVDHQPRSRDELDAELGAVQEALMSAGFEQFVVSADIEHQAEITVVVTRPSGASLDTARKRIGSEIAPSFAVVDDPVVEPQGAFGGMRLQDDGAFLCTSGWTVRRIADGVRGVTGAGHCNPGLNQINHPGHGVHPTFFRQEHIGQWGDVEWYTTNEVEGDDFYSDEFGNIRDVSGIEPRANIAVNEIVCFYGRASNRRDCSLRVANPDVFCGWPQQKLVQMNGSVTLGGDSGGGWSVNFTAYGGHYGICFFNSSFSVADLFDEALGVTVAVT